MSLFDLYRCKGIWKKNYKNYLGECFSFIEIVLVM